MTTQEKVENWFVPLSTEDLTLKQAHSQLDEFGLEQEDIPLIIQLVETPNLIYRELISFMEQPI